MGENRHREPGFLQATQRPVGGKQLGIVYGSGSAETKSVQNRCRTGNGHATNIPREMNSSSAAEGSFGFDRENLLPGSSFSFPFRPMASLMISVWRRYIEFRKWDPLSRLYF